MFYFTLLGRIGTVHLYVQNCEVTPKLVGLASLFHKVFFLFKSPHGVREKQ